MLDTPSNTETLRVGVSSPPEEGLPLAALDHSTAMIVRHLYETPYRINSAGAEPEPFLFDAPLESRGGALVGRVRDGVRLSNGAPLRAGQVATCLATQGPSSLRGAVSHDVGEVRFETELPRAEVERLLAGREALIAVRGAGELLGSGPYVVESASAQRVVLKANPHYRFEVGVPRVELLVVEGNDGDLTEALTSRLESGDIHLTTELPRDGAAAINGVRKKFSPGNGTCILFLNVERLGEPAVREALSMAVDRQAVAGVCYRNPIAYAAKGLLPPLLGRGRDDSRHDPRGAARYFASRPLNRPLKMLRVWAPRPYLPQPVAVSNELVHQFGGVGVKVDVVRTVDPAHYYEHLVAADYDMALCGWISDTSDAVDYYTAILHSDCLVGGGARSATAGNMARLQDRQTDALLSALKTEPTEAAMQAVESHAAGLYAAVPLVYGASVIVHDWRLEDVSFSADGFPRFAAMRFGDH